MSIRAVFFDVYQTLLKLSAPPTDAPLRWEKLCHEVFGSCSITLADFKAGCDAAILREHERAKANGVRFPEVYWPEIVGEALPALHALDADRSADFLYRHAQLRHTFELCPGAKKVLQLLRNRKIPIGIVSNAQPYTLRELDEALDSINLTREVFQPQLCFWSFEAGFAKPDPYVFRMLSARLKNLGIAPASALMVGDRLDNDIVPARTEGWRAWQLRETSGGEFPGGNWDGLMDYLEKNLES